MSKPISLINEKTGELVGRISEAQLQFLQDYLVEEDVDDDDYYIQPATIDMLQAKGADPELINILQQAISKSGAADIRWVK